MKKILQLTTYPIDYPDHGGKLRCFNIRESLKKDFLIDTLSFDIQEEESINGLKVTLSNEKFLDLINNNLFFDWGINNYLEKNIELKEKVFDSVKIFAPDIIMVEQGFLWPFVKEMISLGILNKNVFIIYSSHNIEYIMKREIYSSVFKDKELEKYVDIVKNIEYDMINSSDLIFAVSNFDTNYIKRIVPKTEVLLYRNGHNGIIKTNLKEKWQDKFSKSKRNWVYIASWHGPNINGLYDIVKNGLLNINEKEVSLWVFGSVGPGLLHEYKVDIKQNSSLKIVGPSSEIDIDSAIEASTGIILPIWEGGGSNLKTAQALLSGKKIVASDFAFRGFENFKDEKEVYLSNDPKKLVELISTLDASKEIIIRNDAINELKWENLLNNLSNVIKKYFGEKNEKNNLL
jgi:hypothetical protein